MVKAAAQDADAARALGYGDLLVFCLGSGVALRWCAVAAAAGPSSLTLWLAAFALFYAPLVFCVAYLVARFPGEGGVYLWTRDTQGPFAGFMCGWLYWTANLPYLPGILIFNAAAIAGMAGCDATASRLLFGLAVAMFLGIVALNIVGLRVGKWLVNVGCAALWASIAIVLGAGAYVLVTQGCATPITPATLAPRADKATALLWATVVFAVQGPEAVAFLRSEVRGGQRTVIRALLVAGAGVMGAYLLGTLAVMAVLRPAEVSSLSGLPQAIGLSLAKIGASWLTAPTLVLLVVSGIGLASFYFVASARLPFAAGLNRFLPAAFGRRHPRWGTPYVALLAQAAFVLLFMALAQAGASARQAYDFLVRMGVLGYTVPYVFLFVAVLRASRRPSPGAWAMPGGDRAARALARVGLVATASAIVASVLPDPGETDPAGALIRLGVAVLTLIGSGVAVYCIGQRRSAAATPAR